MAYLPAGRRFYLILLKPQVLISLNVVLPVMVPGTAPSPVLSPPDLAGLGVCTVVLVVGVAASKTGEAGRSA
jgi:hypothetical protein